jgi:hypothetical protein
MVYIIKYYFEEDTDRVDGMMVEDFIMRYDDCLIKSIESDVNVDNLHMEESVSLCEMQIQCSTIETFDLIVGQMETRFGLIPYSIGVDEI